MLSKNYAPDMFRKKAKTLYKDSLLGTVLGISGFVSLGVFIIAICYYALILEPSPESTMFDCGGHSCVQLYRHLTGCTFPDVYNGDFKFTQPSWFNGDAKFASPSEVGIHDTKDNPIDPHSLTTTTTAAAASTTSTTVNPVTGRRMRRFLEDTTPSENENEDSPPSENEDTPPSENEDVTPPAQCEPKDGSSWFIVAGQHSGASNALENILVRLKYSRTDPFSVLNLSWTTATLAWTFSMTGFSLVLPYLGDKYLNPEAVTPSPKEVEMADNGELTE